MSETTTDTEYPIETIADVGLWTTIADAVETITTKPEAVFEFRDGHLRVAVADAAQVALLSMTAGSDAFESYDADTTDFGVNVEQLADVLDAVETDIVEIRLNGETRRIEIRGDAVEYDMAGIDPDSVSGSPYEIPDLVEKNPDAEAVDVDLPVSRWSSASNLIDLAGPDHGTFVADDGTLELVGAGDTDRSRVDLSDHDEFAWNSEPDDRVECVMSNAYMAEVIDVVEDGDDANGTTRFTIGEEYPYQVRTTHADGHIQTHLLQAPRITRE